MRNAVMGEESKAHLDGTHRVLGIINLFVFQSTLTTLSLIHQKLNTINNTEHATAERPSAHCSYLALIYFFVRLLP